MTERTTHDHCDDDLESLLRQVLAAITMQQPRSIIDLGLAERLLVADRTAIRPRPQDDDDHCIAGDQFAGWEVVIPVRPTDAVLRPAAPDPADCCPEAPRRAAPVRATKKTTKRTTAKNKESAK